MHMPQLRNKLLGLGAFDYLDSELYLQRKRKCYTNVSKALNVLETLMKDIWG